MARGAGRAWVAAACLAATLAACSGSAQPASGPSDGSGATPAAAAASSPAGPTATPSRGGPARIVSTSQVKDRMVDITVRSPAVGADVPVRLLLPKGFTAGDGTKYPVLLLLHGCCTNYESWTIHTDLAQSMADKAVLVVMPDGGLAGFYSNWLDGPQWETFHLTELMGLLQAQYGASDRLVVAGLSMGGLGALGYAARHPGMFRAAAAYSPVADTRLSPNTSSGYQELVTSQGDDPVKLWGDPVTDAAVWAQHNPTDLAARLAGVRVFLSVGTGEIGPLDDTSGDLTVPSSIERDLAQENARLRAALRTAKVDATFDFYGPGTHSFPYWEREFHRSWPLLAAALQG